MEYTYSLPCMHCIVTEHEFTITSRSMIVSLREIEGKVVMNVSLVK